MRCPFCGSEDTQVKDSRPVDEASAIRRRRQCPVCGARFTTFERVQLRDLLVVKKDGRRAPFDRDKLARSISIATRKRGIGEEQIERTGQRHRAADRDQRRDRGALDADRRAGDGEPGQARRGRLCPLRLGLPRLRRPCATSRSSSASCPRTRTPSPTAAPGGRRPAVMSAADDRRFMAMALALAERGLGNVWPNPAVGCVLVKDGRVVGRGWTQPGGRPHAESEAIARAGAAARGSTAYVTLEPCAHHGRTPPCADADAGRRHRPCRGRRRRPRPAGRRQGHRAAAGGRHDGRGRLPGGRGLRGCNAGFFPRMRQRRPLVALKLATSADGRIATATGESQWITGAGGASRRPPAAPAPRRDPGRQRHGARRRSDAHLPPARAGGPLARPRGARPPAAPGAESRLARSAARPAGLAVHAGRRRDRCRGVACRGRHAVAGDRAAAGRRAA